MPAKKLSILGSTGSIGTQALEVVAENPDKFSVLALSCLNNVELLKEQVEKFKPKYVCVYDQEKAQSLNLNCEIVSEMQGLCQIASAEESDLVLNALVGSIGIKPTVAAIEAKKNVALANKETLVAAGSIVMELAKKNQVSILPVDSEHSAIFQCLQAHQESLRKIIVTCSGGPFRTLEDLSSVSLEDALAHPNWSMGKKVTIDSSTLMNKGLEVIEAKWLFDLAYDDIEVVVHPQSVIHSLVEFEDSSVLGQLGYPDMRIPIQYALSYPKRIKNNLKPLNLVEISQLDFEEPDLNKFLCLSFAYEAGKIGGTMPCVMNAANEVAVNKFIAGEISYLEIPELIRNTMSEHKLIENPSLEEILEVDLSIRSHG